MSFDQALNAIAESPLSLAMGAHHWVTPTLQTLHILAVAAVMASVLVLDLRLLGVGARDGHFEIVARRYLPWIWRALAVLLVTGGLLVVGEPARSLKNVVFLLKMGLVIAAAALTYAAQGPLRRVAGDQTFPSFAKAFAVLSLCLWAAIVTAGRWIAYV